MYNHKLKQIKFNYFKKKIIETENNSLVLFLEKNNLDKSFKKFDIKKSFIFKDFLKIKNKKLKFVGSGLSSLASINLKNDINFLKDQSCLIIYNSIFWTLSKILNLHLKKNNIETLTSLLLFNLKKTFDLFLPSKFLLLCFKNDFISNK